MGKKVNRGVKPKVNGKKVLKRIRAVFIMLLLGGAGFGIYKLSSSVERPDLTVDSVNYARMSFFEGALYSAEEHDDSDSEDNAVAAFLPQLFEENYPLEVETESQYILVYDVTANEILYAKNANVRCYPASTTKILTAAVILDNVDESFEFTAGDELDFVNPGSSLAYLSRGNVLNTEMVIDALMLASGNDASYTAAANVGRFITGDPSLSARQATDAFVYAMNDTLKKIGADDTVFTNPDGFHDDDHYTTLADMLKVTLYSKDKPLIKESAKKTDRYAEYLTGETVYWQNSNRLINSSNDIYYMYATGLKTGMTDQAGYCVVATAERFGHEVICMVFGGAASDIRWNDTIALLDGAFEYIKKEAADD
ncbi:MAG: D-alanyl-D-alanine carboxypeptidase [Oscillospiraceae bacterium]|nr:D-alanyl-D-alanine carboxypeptidase [Oscillospiraceae bacterium]